MLLGSNRRHWWLMPLSLLAGFLFQAWQHPFWLRHFVPDAILLATLYWALRRPQDMTPGLGFIIGLFRDALYGSLLGQHALSMVLTIYLIQLFTQRIRMFALWQQSAVIGLLTSVYLLVGNWIQLLARDGDDSLHFLLPALTTGVCWPPCYLLLQLLAQVRVPKPAT